MKQTQTATRRTWTVLYSCMCILLNPGCGRSSTHAGAPRVVCATECIGQPWVILDTCTVHCECGRIGNSEILACNVSCRG